MVREATINDIDSINKLGILVNKDYIKLFDVKSILENENEKIYVYEDSKNIIGFIHISILYEVMDIINIVVAENSRKKLVGTNLLDYTISEHNGINKIMLEVNENNKPAISLYIKFGFNIINVREKYYGNDSGLVMERVI